MKLRTISISIWEKSIVSNGTKILEINILSRKILLWGCCAAGCSLQCRVHLVFTIAHRNLQPWLWKCNCGYFVLAKRFYDYTKVDKPMSSWNLTTYSHRPYSHSQLYWSKSPVTITTPRTVLFDVAETETQSGTDYRYMFCLPAGYQDQDRLKLKTRVLS